ncbi:MAG: ABC transporter ATP-binding protein [Betaproteobacteria bacterium]|nr:ABC transporter ATP-binding protein [Betaproteobacteria bacterium]
MLACEKLTLSVPGRMLVREAALEVAPGECWAVLGKNGSGKTTLLHALGGLTSPAQGAVRLDGRPLASYGRRELARRVGVLMQSEDSAFWGSVLEYVLLGRYPHARGWFGWRSDDEALALECLRAMDLAEFAARSWGTLSGGERQRARLAQTLAQDPQLYLLDEPLQHLDLRHQLQALTLFERRARGSNRAVMMVLHDLLWPARYCSHALLIHDGGEVVTGAAHEVLTADNLKRLYGCALRAVDDGAGRVFLPVI